MIQTAAVPMSDTVKFSLLYESLEKNYDSYSGNVIATAGFILLAVGWFLTSKEARGLIRTGGASLFRVVLAVIFLFGIIHTTASVAYYGESAGKMRTILRFGNLEPLPFRDYEITMGLLVLNLVLNWLLLAALAFIVSAAHREKVAPT